MRWRISKTMTHGDGVGQRALGRCGSARRLGAALVIRLAPRGAGKRPGVARDSGIALDRHLAVGSRLMAMAVSRQREYLADATAVEFTRNPRGSGKALEKIRDAEMPFQKATRGTAHLFFVNPLRRRIDDSDGKLADLLSTHPPINRRIMLLYQMASFATTCNAVRS